MVFTQIWFVLILSFALQVGIVKWMCWCWTPVYWSDAWQLSL